MPTYILITMLCFEYFIIEGANTEITKTAYNYQVKFQTKMSLENPETSYNLA